VRESRGVVLAVSDEDTLEAGRLLAEDEGIFVEPAAATSVAGASVARQLGHIDESASVVCLLTGHGLKYQAPRSEPEPESAADGAELVRAIRRDVGDCG
jgi:threonine synthase